MQCTCFCYKFYIEVLFAIELTWTADLHHKVHTDPHNKTKNLMGLYPLSKPPLELLPVGEDLIRTAN